MGPVQSTAALPTTLEQLFPLSVAVELIPMPSISALYQFLMKHRSEFPTRYRTTQGKFGGIEQRLLTESEIMKIREMTIHGMEESRYRFATRGRKPGRGLIDAIIARAQA